MISFWKQEVGLKQTQRLERDGWANVVQPTRTEIEQLVHQYKVPEYVINDILDPDERARTEIEGRWMVVIIRIPIYRPDNSVQFFTVPFGLLISLHTIISICAEPNEIVNDILFSHRTRNIRLDDKVNFVLQIFLSSANYYLKYLKEVNRLTNEIESELEKSTRNSELHRLLEMEKCLVFFITSLKSNELLLNKLQRSKLVNSQEINEDLLDDVTVEYKQAIEIAKVYSDIQNGRMDTFASVISNNLNMVMRRLTTITIILMVPTLVASIFGMNVPNGMEDSPWAFSVLALVMVLLSVIGYLLMRNRKMF
jgi:magnesium transporter